MPERVIRFLNRRIRTSFDHATVKHDLDRPFDRTIMKPFDVELRHRNVLHLTTIKDQDLRRLDPSVQYVVTVVAGDRHKDVVSLDPSSFSVL